MMETESPQPAPPPSRYRTVRRKFTASNAQPVKAAEPVQAMEHHKPVAHTPVQEQPLARQPSKFRRILRLSTHHKEPISLPISPAPQPMVAPYHNKLRRDSDSTRKASTKREEVIELTLDKLVGRSSSRSPEKLPGHDEAVRTLSSDKTRSAYFVDFLIYILFRVLVMKFTPPTLCTDMRFVLGHLADFSPAS